MKFIKMHLAEIKTEQPLPDILSWNAPGNVLGRLIHKYLENYVRFGHDIKQGYAPGYKRSESS
jgi:hypothetical protein